MVKFYSRLKKKVSRKLCRGGNINGLDESQKEGHYNHRGWDEKERDNHHTLK